MQKNASVLTVVGRAFDELVLNSPANIVLEVCSTSCFKTFLCRILCFFLSFFSFHFVCEHGDKISMNMKPEKGLRIIPLWKCDFVFIYVWLLQNDLKTSYLFLR